MVRRSEQDHELLDQEFRAITLHRQSHLQFLHWQDPRTSNVDPQQSTLGLFPSQSVEAQRFLVLYSIHLCKVNSRIYFRSSERSGLKIEPTWKWALV